MIQQVTQLTPNMRRLFADELYKAMEKDTNIYLLVGDLGYKVFDAHFRDFPDRCINCGASEQSMLDIACGMAYDGRKVFTYTISPFYFRAFETIRTYIVHEQIPIVMIGSGRDTDYEKDGFSHNASDIKQVFSSIGGVVLHFPETTLAIPRLVKDAVKSTEPIFISLQRG